MQDVRLHLLPSGSRFTIPAAGGALADFIQYLTDRT
jgi:cyanophycinase